MESIVQRSEIFVLNTAFSKSKLDPDFLVFEELELLKISPGGMVSQAHEQETRSFFLNKAVEAPLMLFSGYSVDNLLRVSEKSVAMERILLVFSQHPKYPGDTSCPPSDDLRVVKRSAGGMEVVTEGIEFVVTHVFASSASELIEMMDTVRMLPPIPFSSKSINIALNCKSKTNSESLELGSEFSH